MRFVDNCLQYCKQGVGTDGGFSFLIGDRMPRLKCSRYFWGGDGAGGGVMLLMHKTVSMVG